MVNSATARRAKVIALVQSGAIKSQTDLVRELKKAGYRVTQATASRDLEDIGAVRSSRVINWPLQAMIHWREY